MDDQLVKTIRTLCTLPGPSGWEDPVRDYLAAQARPYADQLRTDRNGNLLVFKKGRKTLDKTLLFAAHMDEVGILIKSVTDDGYLRFRFVGGVDRRVVLGKQVFVGRNSVPGVIGLKAVHLTTEAERKSVPKVDQLYIDIGAEDRSQALALVQPGDYGVFAAGVTDLPGGYLKAKALDDRVGCGVLLELLKQDLPADAWFAFTVGEESGCRGAFGAAFSIKPDIAVIVEGTTAADAPARDGALRVCAPGKGPVLPFMDGGSIYDHGLFCRLRDLAQANQIPWQTKSYLSGGTDAKAIQRSGGGAKVAAVSAAVRYIHAPSSVGCKADFDDMLRLLGLFMEDLAT